MVWASVVIILLGVAQCARGRELIHSGNPSHLVRRSTVLGRDADGLQDENEISDEVFNGPILYNLHENLRPSSLESLSPDLLQSSFLTNNGKTFLQDEREPFLFVGENADMRPLGERLKNEAVLTDELSATNSNRNSTPLRDELSPEEKFFLRKRLQMNGMGLLGSTNGQKSLIGISKSRPKGLVLSIDMGIKALRDAIMHAKVQQKNRQHQVQAQKNMRLLHNIGKRRVESTPTGDDRP